MFKMNNELRKQNPIVLFAIIASLTYFLSGADILKKFTPRSMCMFMDAKLIALHAVYNAITFIAYVGLGIILYLLYKHLQNKGIPFFDLIWKFAGFIFFCGLTHFFGVLNLYVTYYWLDGAVGLVTAWFSILVFAQVLKNYKKIKAVKTPREFEEVRDKVDEVLELILKK
jgi:hypothetical protein